MKQDVYVDVSTRYNEAYGKYYADVLLITVPDDSKHWRHRLEWEAKFSVGDADSPERAVDKALMAVRRLCGGKIERAIADSCMAIVMGQVDTDSDGMLRVTLQLHEDE